MNNIEKQASRLFPVILNGMQNNSYKEFLQSTLIASIAIAYDDKAIMEQAKETNKNIGVFIKENLPTSKYRKVAARVDRTINNFWSYLNPEYQENSESMLPLLKINILNPNDNFVNDYTVKEAFTSILGIIILNCNYGKLDKLKADALFNIINNYLISEALKNPKIMKRMELIKPTHVKKPKQKPKKTNLKKDLEWLANKKSFDFNKIDRTKLIYYEGGYKPMQQYKSTRKFPLTGYWGFIEKHRPNNKWKAYLRISKNKYWEDVESSGYCKEPLSAWDSLIKKLNKDD